MLAKKIANFEERLPSPQSELAAQTMKAPYVFDFIPFKEDMVERDIEQALVKDVTKLLLELGTGFAFLGNQYHLNVGGDDFYIDLLFYNLNLRCYVVIELKTQKLTHQDLGQLQMYVNYYDRYVKTEDENPTIGILLCTDKNDTAVKLALPENNQTILASKYQLYLPTTEQLINEINEVKRTAEKSQNDYKINQ